MVKKSKVVEKKKEKEAPKPAPIANDLKAIESKRNDLINEIKPNLLSKSMLKKGGSNVRRIHASEKGYEPALVEINELGTKLGLSPIGLGHLRKE